MEEPEKVIIDGIAYTGVSMDVYVAIQLVNSTKELVTEEYLSYSISRIIKAGKDMQRLTGKDITQIFDLTDIPEEQRKEILEKVDS